MSAKLTLFPGVKSKRREDEARDETERLAQWSNTLIAMQSQIGSATSFEDVMKTVLASAMRAMPSADGAAIALLKGHELAIAEAIGTMWPQRGKRLSLTDTLSAECIRTGEPATFDDALCDPRVSEELFARFGARSATIVPISLLGERIGVMVFHSRVAGVFSQRDVLTAQLLTGPLAIAYSGWSRQTMETRLSTQARRFAATFEQAAVGIAHVAPDGRFLLINNRFCEIAGYSKADLMADGFQQITHPDDLETDIAHVEELLEGRSKTYSMEKRYIRKDGAIVWVNLTVSLVRDEEGEPEFFVAVIEDISDRKRAEIDAARDPLTGVFNRRALEKRLKLALDSRRHSELPLGVVYMDLDGFKGINDTLGHAEGDRCLVTIAEALKGEIREQDLLGRLGGDEFLILLPSTEREATDAAIQRIQKSIGETAAANNWDLAISVGAVVLPLGTEISARDAIAAADHLMYEAKKSRTTSAVVEDLGDLELIGGA